jgi:hypothetical protein
MRDRIAALFVCIAFLAPTVARADGQLVHRCIGVHGEISFSGLPCAQAGATDAPPSSAAATASTDVRGAVADTCPASADALRDLVASAFARRDANTLAGVMRWDGVGGAEARSRMRELAELTRRPLLGVDFGEGAAPADDAGVDPSAAAAETTWLTVRTGTLEGGPGDQTFRVVPEGGCYWLEW